MASLAVADVRREPRDGVYYRARAFGPDARELKLLIVNLSRGGLMARCDPSFARGDRIRISLPIVGALAAEVRWALGGRIGCQFDTPIDIASYYELLSQIMHEG